MRKILENYLLLNFVQYLNEYLMLKLTMKSFLLHDALFDLLVVFDNKYFVNNRFHW
jgi:hypothetical protein